MKFFDRSKILFRVLSVIAVLLAVILLIKSFSLDTLNLDFDTLFFFGGCVLLLMLIIALITLRCVIRDAEEDMQALLRYSENKTQSL